MNFITITLSQTAHLSFQGYFFDRVGFVYLSAANNTIFPYVCAVNYFTDNIRLSSAFIPISGYPYTDYTIQGDNGLSINLYSLPDQGLYDIIVGNAAGYTKLSSRNYLISAIDTSVLPLLNIPEFDGVLNLFNNNNLEVIL